MQFKHGTSFSLLLFGLLIANFISTSTFAQTVGNCGRLSSPEQYGPYDYRNQRDKLPIVESNHFRPEIETLISGDRTKDPGGDIDYTLRAIPNHHRALLAMMRLGEREKTSKPNHVSYTIECWFKRAIEFRPDDSIVRMIYSTYLNKNGRTPDANAQLDIATVYAKDNAFTHYNIGLHYFDFKNYDQALIQAHKAMALGFSKTELRDQLRSIGKWTEPPNSETSPTVDSTLVEPAK